MHLPRKFVENFEGRPLYEMKHETPTWERHAMDLAPLFGRGWTVQERYLSPRTLYFGAILTWACCEHSRSEFNEMGLSTRPPQRPATLGPFKREFLSRPPIGSVPGEDQVISLVALRNAWATIQTAYARSKLSDPSDAPIALQGLINFLEQRSGFQNIARLWRPLLATQLLWQKWKSGGQNLPIERLAPS